uniref:HTH_7 domain-containing protein n=1 Tax=Ascaris lumbricoides TaxID=6252 RepID=A0A0M3HYA4_ASCLU
MKHFTCGWNISVKRHKSMRCLPERGVLEEDGTPFYHVRQTYLRPDQLQRLKECGVVIKKGLFDADEDRKIQRNWEYYAKENGLPLDAAYEYAGGYSVEKKNAGEQLEHVRQLHSTRLVPIMTGKILWTKEAEEELKSLLKRGFSAKQIQHLMGITISSIVHHMRKLGLDEDPASSNLPLKELTPLQKAYLFRIVSSGWLGKRCRLCATLKIALEFAISKDFEERMKQVDFGSMCGKLGMTLSQIKGCWLREAKRLRQTYEEFGRNAMKVYAKYNLPLRRISVDEWQRVLEICREQNVDSIYDFDKTLVHERMMKEGLTGFYTSGLKEGAFVINKIGWSVNRARVQCEKDIPAVRKLSFNGWIEILMKYNRSTHCNFDGVTRFMTKGNIFILKSIVVKYLRKIGVPLEEIPNYETLAKGISRKFQRFDNVSDVTDSEDPFNEDNIDNSTFIEKAEEKNEPTEVIDTFEEEPNSAGEFLKNSRCAGSESEDSASLVSVQCRDEIPHEERFSKSSGPGVERADNTKQVAELLGEGSSSGGEVHRKSGNVNSVQEGEVVEIQQINEEEEVKNCVGNDKPKRKCPKKTIKEEKRNDYKEVILKEVLSDDKPATNFKRRHNILESEFPSRLETAAEEVRSAERKRLKRLKKHRKKHLYDEVEVLRGNECASVDVDVSVDVLEDGQLIENKTTKWEEDPQNSTNDGIARVKKNINNMEENIESWVKLYEAQSVNEDDGNTTESERRRLKKLKKERKRLLKEHSSEAVVEDGDVKVHNRDEEELLLAAHETANALVTSVTEDDELDGKRLKRLRKAERKRLRMEEVLNGTVENESVDIQGDTVERSQHELKECSSKHTLHESAAIDEEKLEKRILKKLKRNNKKFDDDAVPKIEVEATAIRSECSEKQKDEGEAAVNELISID